MHDIDPTLLLSAIAATSRDCIVCVDLDETVIWASAAAEPLLGWPPSELVGRPISALARPGATDVRSAHVAQVLAGQDAAPYVDVLARRDGTLVATWVTLGALRDAAGDVVGVTSILRDARDEVAVQPHAQGSLERALARRSWDTALVTDAAFEVVHATPAAARMLGYAPDELVGRTVTSLLHAEDVEKSRTAVERVLAQPEHPQRCLSRMQDRAGSWHWIEGALANCLAEPDLAGLVVNLQDLTDRVEGERLLRFSEALHRAIVETAQEGIVATAPDGTTMLANEKVGEILGLSLESLTTLDVPALLRRFPGGEEPVPTVETTNGPEQFETKYRHPDGRTRVLHVTRSLLHHDGAEPLGWLSMVSDVTDERRVQDELRRQALHDPLTALPNRYLVLDRLKMAAARQRRTTDAPMGVLFLDLDGFKPINDSQGHEAGDELLKEVGTRLAAAVRATDTVGRLGGDEFAVICENADEAAVLLVASRIHEALAVPIELTRGPVRMGVSIGVAMSPPHEVAHLIRLADVAMYEAKELGGGRTALAAAPRDGGQSPAAEAPMS